MTIMSGAFCLVNIFILYDIILADMLRNIAIDADPLCSGAQRTIYKIISFIDRL